MSSFSFKIAYAIVTTGLFIMAVFVAGTYTFWDPHFYVVLIPLTAFLFLFGILMGQRFTLPMKNLIKEANHLSHGDTKSRFYPESRDEVGQLASAFNRVAEEFEHHQSQIQSLDAKVKLRTQTLEGIIAVLEQKIKNRTGELEKSIDHAERLAEAVRQKELEIARLRRELETLQSKKRKK